MGEYLYVNNEVKPAAALNCFAALSRLVNSEITSRKLHNALDYAKTASETYGIIGYILELQVCQAGVTGKLQDHEKDFFIQYAPGILQEIENKKKEPASCYYLKLFGWDQVLKKRYGSLKQYLTLGRNFFYRIWISVQRIK